MRCAMPTRAGGSHGLPSCFLGSLACAHRSERAAWLAARPVPVPRQRLSPHVRWTCFWRHRADTARVPISGTASPGQGAARPAAAGPPEPSARATQAIAACREKVRRPSVLDQLRKTTRTPHMSPGRVEASFHSSNGSIFSHRRRPLAQMGTPAITPSLRFWPHGPKGTAPKNACCRSHRLVGRGGIPAVAGDTRVRWESVELGEYAPSTSGNLGGALFCDRRDKHVFTYHNGAESCDAVLDFRGLFRV